MTTKKTINILFVFPSSVPKGKESSLTEYIPLTACSTDITTLYVKDSSEVSQYIQTNGIPDIILHYSLGVGSFWQDSFLYWKDENTSVEIPSIVNNDSVFDLFYGEKTLYNSLFDTIKKTILDIDTIKNRPSKLYIAKTKADLDYITNKCMTEPFAFDTETNFLNPFIKRIDPEILCFSIAWMTDEEEGWCIPYNKEHIESAKCEFTLDEVKQYAQKIFFESEQSKFAHNLMYDMLAIFETHNFQRIKNVGGCTMLLCNTYHHASKSAKLKDNLYLVNMPAYKDPIKEYISSKGNSANGFKDVPLDIIAPYAAMDAIAVARLVNFFKKNLLRSLWSFYYTIPHKILLTAFELAYEGYTISKDRYYYTKHKIEEELKLVFKEVKHLLKDYVDSATFNVNSPKQLATVLYDKLKLPIMTKTTKGLPATNEKALNSLMLFHPLIFKLLKFKKINKLYSTYITTYRNVLNEGSRKYTKTQQWTFNSQYMQINRTARLSATNMEGHVGTAKKGGNILTLPAAGSLIKHYFAPEPVVELENNLFDRIIEKYAIDHPEKYKDYSTWITEDISTSFKPAKKPTKPRLKKVVTAALLPEDDVNTDEAIE